MTTGSHLLAAPVLEPAGRLSLEAAGRAPELERVVKAFAKDTRQRYMDPTSELGIMGLHLAVERFGGQQALPPDPFRRALFVVTARGPNSARAKLLEGYRNPAKGALSGTIFSNCGYNIAGSLMARSQSIRGAVLTFGATPGCQVQLQAMVRSFFAKQRADWLALAVLDEERVELSWFVREMQ